jgi:hypothetical protein
MRTLAAALTYTMIAAAMAYGFVAAAMWLVAPDLSVPRVARAAPPLPPRIAESIARKMEPVPEQPRDAPLAPVSIRPAMQEAQMQEMQVSLARRPGREVKIRDLMPAPAPNRPRKSQRRQPVNTATAAASEVPSAVIPIAAGRSDMPY